MPIEQVLYILYMLVKDFHLDFEPGLSGSNTHMYSRCAEWTAAALLYRHNTMAEDNTSSMASNCRVKTKGFYTLFTTIYTMFLVHEDLLKLYSRLTANPKAEALWRMMETAATKQRQIMKYDFTSTSNTDAIPTVVYS